MKKLTILFILFFTVFHLSAQNVAINNDGTSAATSAMLDVKSTTKGFMMPRVTSAQRTAIASPAIGLLVFDTDTKTIWTYDGNAWKNLYTSGGGLVLPYSQSINLATSAFQIANQGTGAAIEGSSSAQFGIGMTAKTTGEGGWGLFASSNGAGAQSIRSFADNGTAFHGENNNSANTNTLMNLLNKGAGISVRSQLTNASSEAANTLIAGNHLGHQLKVYQTNASNTVAAVSIENSGTGSAIEATSTTGYGIKGVTTTALGMAGVHGQNNGTAGSGVVGVSHAANTQGVYGTSQNGVAVRALGDNYRAVQANSNTGTALHATSTSGYALESNGKVKIAGGNTNPGAGKVLTSDANGNATWQQPTSQKVGFRASGWHTNYINTPPDVQTKLHFEVQDYDYSGSYIALTENGNGTEADVFHVVVPGLYHFEAKATLQTLTADIEVFIVKIVYERNGVVKVIADGHVFDPTYASLQSVHASGDFKLQAGDKVWVEIEQGNDDDEWINLWGGYSHNIFSGHLVFAD